MTFNPADWPRVKAVFDGALERDPDARREHITAACGDDSALLAQVEALLVAHDRAIGFLETQADPTGNSHRTPGGDVVGRNVGSYRVVSPIGAGGMGEVYLAHDDNLQRPVAVKLISWSAAIDDERLRRFHAEARAASSLNHPHILVVHDLGEHEGRPYLVTEFVEGETLRQRLSAGPLSVRDAVDIATQVASALAAAHARGIVHRDIKPENVMVRPDGFVKVLDFGLAKLTTLEYDDAASMRTRPGLVMGTPRYMSPEQARGLAVDVRTDVWSVGVVLYEMIAGRPPFEGPTPTDLIAAILRTDPEPVDVHARHAPKAVVGLIMRALTKDAGGRFDSARELHEELARLKTQLDSGGLSGHPRSSSNPSRSRATAARPATRRRTAGAIESLAVLPFVNGGGDPDSDYFCDGVTESLIGTLSTLPKLRVMARSTTFRYKGKDIDPLEVGRELNVRAVLTGRLTQRSDRLAIALELVDVAEGWRLWGAHYDAALADVFNLQETIATEVSEKLRLRLSGTERTRLTRRHTEHVGAYQAYLRGRYSWNRRIEAGFRQAIKYFEQAIAADPVYALPYAGLADCYALLGIAEYGGMPPHEAMPKAKWAAQKALELDERLAEAHTTLAHVAGFYDWDWSGSEREFRRAIELNPQYAFAHHWLALLLAALGRLDEAIASELRALELEPLSLIINKNVGTIYYYARQHERSIEQYRKALDLDPDFARTHFYLAMAYETTERRDEAVEEFRRGLTLSGGSAVVLGVLGYALARAGRDADAREVLDDLSARGRTQYVPAFTQALVHIGLGDVDQAFAYLDRAFHERSSWLVSMQVEPLLDPVRGDPRYADLVRRVGLP